MTNFNKLQVKNYNLDSTLSGGQTFVWDKIEDIWYGKTVHGLIILKQTALDTIEWQTFPDQNNYEEIKEYLRTDFDYDDLLEKTKGDNHFKKSLSKYKGMRLLKQDVDQTIISFIISANNSFTNIKNSVAKLSQMFGNKISYSNNEFYLFPEIRRLANASVEDIRKASVGYRAEYIVETAKMLNDGILNSVADDEEIIRNSLLKLKGVGNKVADCVLSFAYAYDNIAPIDVWVGRILSDYYGVNTKLSYKNLRKWTKENMHGYASWVSQYLFEYIRSDR